jgi:hypothetical protein
VERDDLIVSDEAGLAYRLKGYARHEGLPEEIDPRVIPC